MERPNMPPAISWFCGNCGLPHKADLPHVCLDKDELFKAAQVLLDTTPRCHAEGCKKLSTKHASWFWCDAHAPDGAVEQPGAAVVRVLEPVLACQ